MAQVILSEIGRNLTVATIHECSLRWAQTPALILLTMQLPLDQLL